MAGDTSIPFRILHLSDIHFGAHFDSSLWGYVCRIAEFEAPHLILCSGDVVDHGGLFMLAAAKKELDRLASLSKNRPPIRAVPGNHDVGIFGNIRVWPFSRNFHAVFGKQCMSIPNYVPAYTSFAEKSFLRRGVLRGVGTIHLYINRIAHWFRTARQTAANALPLTRDDDPHEVFIAYLDSNHATWLATGRVSINRVTSLQSAVMRLREGSQTRVYVPRIAMVHHHVLPIPYSDIKEGLTSYEPFLVLRDAGTVVRELCRNDFDLVLHGHKHYSSFCRLGYLVDSEEEGELAVLAAGSAGITFGEAGRNSINLVDVYPSGQIRYTPVHFGGGKGATVEELRRGARPIHPLVMQKRRAYRRALELHRQEAECVQHECYVDESGDAPIVHRVVNFRTSDNRGGNWRPVRAQTSLGRIDPARIRLDENSRSVGYTLSTREQGPEPRVTCLVDLGFQPSKSMPPISYGVKYVAFNAFAMTKWEVEQHRMRANLTGKPNIRFPEQESAGVVVRFPTKRLEMAVTLPMNIDPATPDIRVSRVPSYWESPLDEYQEYGGDAAGCVADHVMTAHEKTVGFREAGNHRWVLEVEYPVVGYLYEILWPVCCPEEVSSTELGAATSALRRALIKRAKQPGEGDNNAFRNQLSSLGNETCEDIKRRFASLHTEDESVSMALFVYDEDTRVLRLVAEGMAGGSTGVSVLEIPLDEGVTASAFKSRRVKYYVSPKLPRGTRDAGFLYEPPGNKNPQYGVLIAIPMVHPRVVQARGLAQVDAPEGFPPQETVGVVTIASTALDTQLLAILAEEGVDALDDTQPPGAKPARPGLRFLVSAASCFLQRAMELAAPGSLQKMKPEVS